MKSKLVVVLLVLSLATMGFTARISFRPGLKSASRREVRHELLMLPYFGVFDSISYKVDGSTVTLLGEVVRPVTNPTLRAR